MPKFYDKYWEDKVGYLSDFNLKWPKLKKYIPLNEGITIVDFGCGNGQILKEISLINPMARCIGLDVSELALKRAKNLLPNCEFYKIEDGGRFPLENHCVDFVFSSEVIEHIYDVENAFSEIARVLKSGGQLLLTTPYHGLIKNFLIILFVFDSHFDPTGPHIRFFSKKTLFNLLKRYGFKIIKCGYYGRFYPVPCSIYILAEKK